MVGSVADSGARTVVVIKVGDVEKEKEAGGGLDAAGAPRDCGQRIYSRALQRVNEGVPINNTLSETLAVAIAQ